ncbi:MAG: tyrosine--tRNA ligase [bacterium]|nr:tyrosine--tRNA ligase [bacterium]
MKTNFDIIKERGYIYQSTNEGAIKKLLNSSCTFYLGIDPTADSLHIGHFFALTLVRRLQQMGHKAIVLVGGATALVGDPTGKKDMRKILTKEIVDHNKEEVKQLIKRFVDVEGDNKALILDNSDWINKETYIDFMRNIGIHFNVNKMLATDCYKNRLEEGGLTFLEMGYMLMQAYDFVYLNNKYNCMLEIGGSDQWANMVAGVELARKIDFSNNEPDRELQSLTCPLLVKADGEKMGKTASGTLWVSRDKTSIYDFYQMFINSYDEDVERLLLFFSDIEVSEIKQMCRDNIIEAKKVMAYEVTKLVHGEEEALKVKKMSEDTFSGNIDNMPTIKLDFNYLKEKVDVKSFLVDTNICASKSDARRLIEQGGIKLNQEKIANANIIINDLVKDGFIIIQKGKKTHLKVIIGGLNEQL